MQISSARIRSLFLGHNSVILDVHDPGFLKTTCDFMEIGLCNDLERLLAFARDRLGARKAVVEKAYVDADYLYDYCSFYGRGFSPPSPQCGRIHLFSCRTLPGTDLLALNRHRKQYLGYVIVRPTGETAVGRTCLRKRQMRRNREYLLCKHTFSAHVNGARLEVEAFPFITQDANTFVCAGAAIWMQAYYMHEHFGFPRYYPAQITEIARRYSIRGNIRAGMFVEDMGTALRDMGYNPHVYTYSLERAATPVQRALFVRRTVLTAHAIVESRLPCILAVSGADPENPKRKIGHALTAIGHSFETPGSDWLDQFFSEDPDCADVFSNELFNGDWVTWFVVHDDQKTPYGRLWVWDTDRAKEGEFCLNKDVDHVALIVPMPQEVSLELPHVALFARGSKDWWNNWLEDIVLPEQTAIRNDPGKYHKQLRTNWLKARRSWRVGEPRLGDFEVTRFYLDPSEEFKRRVENSGMHDDFKRIYRAMSLPKYVWVAEFASLDKINSELEKNRLIRGEVIIDSTASPYADPWPILSFHYRGRLAFFPSGWDRPLLFCRKESEYRPAPRGAASSRGR